MIHPEKLSMLRTYHTRLVRAGIHSATIPADQLGELLADASDLAVLAAPVVKAAPTEPESDADEQC